MKDVLKKKWGKDEAKKSIRRNRCKKEKKSEWSKINEWGDEVKELKRWDTQIKKRKEARSGEGMKLKIIKRKSDVRKNEWRITEEEAKLSNVNMKEM